MDKSPKRRKYKDNPYTLIKDASEDIYIIKFKDSKNKIQIVKVDSKVYEVFDNSELHDLKELNEYDNHIEHLLLDENQLYRRMFNKVKSLDSLVEDEKIFNNLKNEIQKLPDIQKNRLKKYFFDGKTYEQIAYEEGCSKVAIKYSLEVALKKISKKFKI